MQRKWKRSWKRAAAKMIVSPLAASLLLLPACSLAFANPTGGIVADGSATILSSGSTMTINQTTNKTIINWQRFSIGQGETVNFVQPSGTAVALNRVVGNDASAIYGTLQANGKVYLINPNGILFAKGAQVNVGGLVASTLNLPDSDFTNGQYTFCKSGSAGGVTNQGRITAANEAVLIGPQIVNEGVITAKVTGLTAGNQVSLDFSGDSLINLAVNTQVAGASVKNSGTILADGGLVVMSASTKDALLNTVVNNSGVICAQTLTNSGGVIRLEGGTVNNSGIIDASSKHAGQTGGIVKVFGDTVTLASNSRIDVSGDAGGGTALIGGAYQGGLSEYAATNTMVEQGAAISADAITIGNGGNVVVWSNDVTNFAGTITAKGGSIVGGGGNVEVSGKKTLTYQGHSDTTAMNGKTGSLLLDPGEYLVGSGVTSGNVKNNGELASELATNSITLSTDGTGTGNITIAAPVIWTADTILTLHANNNININDNITANGKSAGLVLAYGPSGSYNLGNGAQIILSGATPTLSIGGSSYTVLNAGNFTTIYPTISLAGQYALGCDVDANGQILTPIGSNSTPFTGKFDGLGHCVSNLSIAKSGIDNVGLFGYSKGTIRNLWLLDPSISARAEVGSLVGYNTGLIDNCHVIVSAGSAAKVYSTGGDAGGLVGNNNAGTISNCSSDVTVVDTTAVAGGLAGYSSGSIIRSYSTGAVSATGKVGGLIGFAAGNCSITDCHATGDVTGGTGGNVGGLVGISKKNKGVISGSYSMGNITSNGSTIGGLIGCNDGSPVSSCYSNGTVSGTGYIGGLIGWNDAAINDSYSTGKVTGSGSYIGGLVGWNEKSSISGCWLVDPIISGKAEVGGLVGYNTGLIDNCHVTVSTGSAAKVYSTGGDVGGLVGNNNAGTISNSSSSVTVIDTTAVAGGLAGYSSGSIIRSYSTGAVSATGKVGGLVGFADGGAITDCYATGDVTLISGTATFDTWGAGGLVGYNSAVIMNCHATGDIVAYNGSNYYSGSLSVDAGGLVGRNASGNITNSYSAGAVTGTVTGSGFVRGVGGLVGSLVAGTISGCYHTAGAVYLNGMEVGGLVGVTYPNTVVEYSYNDAAVTGQNAVGGLIGNKDGILRYSYNAGNVSATIKNRSYYYFGGLVGLNNGPVTQCYNIGSLEDVIGCIGVGGIAGTGPVPGNYWSTDNNPSISSDSTGLTLAQMKSSANFAGWDIAIAGGSNKIWRMYEGSTYPLLRQFLIPLTVTGAAKTYDKEVYSGNTGLTYSRADVDLSLIHAENLTYSGAAVGAVDVGTYGFTADGLWSSQQGYDISYASSTLTISPKALTARQSGTVTKTYDGNIAAAFDNSSLTLDGIIVGDSVDVSGVGTYAGKNAGLQSVTLTGVTLNNGNYTLAVSDVAGGRLSGQITPKALTATQATTVTKTYDGNTAATVSSSNLTLDTSGVIAGDSVNILNGTGSYAGKNAGLQSVTLTSVTLDNGNYTLAASDVAGGRLSGQITPKALTATQATTVTKTYDGNTGATVSVSNLTLDTSGVIAGDSVNILNGTGSYAGQNAGLQSVTLISVTLDNGNYTLAASDVAGGQLSGQITPKALTATQATTVTKTYDGNTGATVSTSNLTLDTSGVIAGDSVNILNGTGSYAGKNAGFQNVTLTSVTLDNGNYTLAASDVAGGRLNGQITPKALTATQATTVSKAYDGNTVAAFDNSNLTLNGVVAGDTVTVNGVGSYAGRNAGLQNVVLTGLTLDNGNYTLAVSDVVGGQLSGQITPKALTATQATTVTKTYDGNTGATVSASNLTLDASGVIAGDSVNILNGTGSYAGKNAGLQSVTLTGVTLDNGNYTLAVSDVAGGRLNGQITPKALTATQATMVSKVYDGNTVAAFDNSNLTLSGVVAGDTVTVNGVGSYVGKNAGLRNVALTGVTLDNGNYTLAASDVAGGRLSGQITPKALTATQATMVSKVYDGNMVAAFDNSNLTLSGVVADDIVAVNGVGSYAGKNAGLQNVALTGITLDNGNYTLAVSDVAGGRLSGQITPKALTATQATMVTKTYDGNTAATVNAANLTLDASGIITGDSVSILSGTGTYADKNAGPQSVTLTGVTLDNGNYTMVAGGRLSGQISKALLAITASDVVKSYGQTDLLSNYTVSGLVSGDGVNSVSLSSYGADAAAKTGKYIITASDALGIGLDNYNIIYQNGTLTVNEVMGQSNGYRDAVVSAHRIFGDRLLTGREDFLPLSIMSPGVNMSGYTLLTDLDNYGQNDD